MLFSRAPVEPRPPSSEAAPRLLRTQLLRTLFRSRGNGLVALALFILFTLAWFAPLGVRSLLPTDEGRYAEIAREMFASGNWITPRYNGYLYFEKPPLQMWATALSYTLFGVGDWQARLWTACCGFGTILLVAFTGARLFGPVAGVLAGIVLASTPYWHLMGHYASLDMGLAAMLTVALCAFLLAQRAAASAAPARRPARRWMLVSWAAMALAVLSKGLIGCALPAFALIVYSILTRDGAVWRRLYPLSGLLVFCLICAPWFVLVQHRNPTFFDFFFINEHWRRYLDGAHRRPGPPYYFVPVLVIGVLPWLSMLTPALRQAWRLPRQPNGFSATRFLCIWAAVIFVFFSISQSKLISYALPVVPALALLLGAYLRQVEGTRIKAHLLGYLVGLLSAALGVVYLTNFGATWMPNAVYQSYQRWLWLTFGIGLVGVGWLAWTTVPRPASAAMPSKRRRDTWQTWGLYALIWCAMLDLAGNAYQVFGRVIAGVDLAAAVRPALRALPAQGAGTPFYSVDLLDHTMPFYLRHAMTMVRDPGELAFGTEVEPDKWIPTLADWEQRWRDGGPAFALMRPELYRALRAAGLPMTFVARDSRRVVVRR